MYFFNIIDELLSAMRHRFLLFKLRLLEFIVNFRLLEKLLYVSEVGACNYTVRLSF